MPTIQEHIDKAEHNELMARSLIHSDAVDYFDWVVISLFYSALHYVDAYLIRYHAEPRSHEERREFIRSTRPGWDIEYRNLKDEGYNARYFVYSIDSERLNCEILPNFETIKNTILTSIGPTSTP